MVMGVVGVRTSCSAVLKSEYGDVEGMVVVEGVEVEREEDERLLLIEEEEEEEKQ